MVRRKEGCPGWTRDKAKAERWTKVMKIGVGMTLRSRWKLEWHKAKVVRNGEGER